MKMKTTGFKIVLIATIAWIFVAPSSVYAQMEQMEKQEMDMGTDMKMDMYKVAAIDGCSDFHCRKCSDRKACSRGEGCSMENCGHEHGAVLCHGGILFYLRESQGFEDAKGRKSCFARAEHVANQLNKMLNMMKSHEDCYFTVGDENNEKIRSDAQTPVIWFTMQGEKHMTKVLSVTSSDLWGYSYRAGLPDLRNKAMSPELLTSEIVAQWWAYTLKDHFSMMILSQKPYLTTYTRSGKVLEKMYERARRMVPEGKIPMQMWTQVVNELPTDDRDDLYLAAQIVPKDFDPGRR